MDLVEDLEPDLGPRLAALGGRFLVADALEFAPEEPFDALWDHTFFCSLPIEDRQRFGAMARRVLAPTGRVHSLVFPCDRPLEQGGPPWRMTPADLLAALGPEFTWLEDRAVAHPAPGRAWTERWAALGRAI